MKNKLLNFALAFGAAVAFHGAAGAMAAEQAPSGLTETWRNWSVVCRTHEQKRNCTFSQQQRRKDGALVLAIELTASDKGGLKGTALLPFGLELAKGVGFAVDDKVQKGTLPFKTCRPAGCVVPLALTEAQVKTLRSGKTLKLTATASDTGQPVELQVFLAGFTEALDRTIVLLGG